MNGSEGACYSSLSNNKSQKKWHENTLVNKSDVRPLQQGFRWHNWREERGGKKKKTQTKQASNWSLPSVRKKKGELLSWGCSTVDGQTNWIEDRYEAELIREHHLHLMGFLLLSHQLFLFNASTHSKICETQFPSSVRWRWRTGVAEIWRPPFGGCGQSSSSIHSLRIITRNQAVFKTTTQN